MGGRAVIRLGDWTSHGGRVIEATARMTIDGIPVARWQDHCSCPILGHNNPVICEGDIQAVYDGRPIALEGHKTSCGASLIPSQKNRCTSQPLIKATQVITAGASSALQTGSLGDSPLAEEDKLFDRRFQLADMENGQLHSNQRYRITTSQGVFEGITDDDGITENIDTGDSEDDMHIELLGD